MVICDSVTADRASTLIMNYDNDENEEDIEYIHVSLILMWKMALTMNNKLRHMDDEIMPPLRKNSLFDVASHAHIHYSIAPFPYYSDLTKTPKMLQLYKSRLTNCNFRKK